MTRLYYGSLFSGIEAASVAWEPLGWQASSYAEIDPFACALLAHRYPAVPNLGDVTKLKGDDLGTIDVLIGGSPCQSFSVAGKRAGLDDPRGNLTLEFLRLVSERRPRWVVWENVPGVLSIDDGLTFGTVLGTLGQCGYGFAYRVLDAQYFGVPQRRRRVFVVGYFGDWRPAAAVLLERESLSGNPPPSRGQGEEVAGVFTSRSKSGGWGTDVDLAAGGYMRPSMSLNAHGQRNDGESGTFIPLDTRQTSRGGTLTNSGRSRNERSGSPGLGVGKNGDPAYTLGQEPGAIAHSLRSEGADASEDGTGRVGPMVITGALPANTHPGGATGQDAASGLLVIQTAFTKSNGSGISTEGQAYTLDKGTPQPVAFDLAQITSKANRTRAEEGLPVSTMNAAGQLHVAQPMSVRRLTPRECERLQGFPDDWTLIPYRGKAAADEPRYRALGNSMATPVVYWVGKRIQMVEDLLNANKAGVAARGT